MSLLYFFSLSLFLSTTLEAQTITRGACLYAGWPSTTSPRGRCLPPWETNQGGLGPVSHRSFSCPGNGIRCNPSYFGRGVGGQGVCISGAGVDVANYTHECLKASTSTPALIERYRSDEEFRKKVQPTLGPEIGRFCLRNPLSLSCISGTPQADPAAQPPAPELVCFRGQLRTREEIDQLARSMGGVGTMLGDVGGLSLLAEKKDPNQQSGLRDDPEAESEARAPELEPHQGGTGGSSGGVSSGGQVAEGSEILAIVDRYPKNCGYAFGSWGPEKIRQLDQAIDAVINGGEVPCHPSDCSTASFLALIETLKRSGRPLDFRRGRELYRTFVIEPNSIARTFGTPGMGLGEYKVVRPNQLDQSVQEGWPVPGDFVLLNRTNRSGHMTVFSHFEGSGENRSICYWSSNRGTNGMGVQCERMSRMDSIHIGRAQ